MNNLTDAADDNSRRQQVRRL